MTVSLQDLVQSQMELVARLQNNHHPGLDSERTKALQVAVDKLATLMRLEAGHVE